MLRPIKLPSRRRIPMLYVFILLFTAMMSMFILLQYQYNSDFLGDLVTAQMEMENEKGNAYENKRNLIDGSTTFDEWIPFGSYLSIPSFFVKNGSNEMTENNMISLATICDLNLLYRAVKVANEYKAGPISIAIFIDADYRTFSQTQSMQITATLKEYFGDSENAYPIICGLLFINKDSAYYKSKHFEPSTNLIFKIPTNALRNLAELQVETKYVFNIDVDFWHFSELFHDTIAVKSLLFNMDYITQSNPNSVFIVPPFEINPEYANSAQLKLDMFGPLGKSDLIANKHEIIPFHLKSAPNAQACTDFGKWYDAETNYKVNYSFCHYAYEPWYIMNTNLSRIKRHQFDNDYIGRGLNKVERTFTLRHYCFDFVVMSNLFIIHGNDKMKKPVKSHSNGIYEREYQKWVGINEKMFKKQKDKYQEQIHSENGTCSTQMFINNDGEIKRYRTKSESRKRKKKKTETIGMILYGTCIGLICVIYCCMFSQIRTKR